MKFCPLTGVQVGRSCLCLERHRRRLWLQSSRGSDRPPPPIYRMGECFRPVSFTPGRVESHIPLVRGTVSADETQSCVFGPRSGEISCDRRMHVFGSRRNSCVRPARREQLCSTERPRKSHARRGEVGRTFLSRPEKIKWGIVPVREHELCERCFKEISCSVCDHCPVFRRAARARPVPSDVLYFGKDPPAPRKHAIDKTDKLSIRIK